MTATLAYAKCYPNPIDRPQYQITYKRSYNSNASLKASITIFIAKNEGPLITKLNCCVLVSYFNVNSNRASQPITMQGTTLIQTQKRLVFCCSMSNATEVRPLIVSFFSRARNGALAHWQSLSVISDDDASPDERRNDRDQCTRHSLEHFHPDRTKDSLVFTESLPPERQGGRTGRVGGVRSDSKRVKLARNISKGRHAHHTGMHDTCARCGKRPNYVIYVRAHSN